MNAAPGLAALAAVAAVAATAHRARAPALKAPGGGRRASTSPALARCLAAVGRSRVGRLAPRHRVAALLASIGTPWSEDELAGARVLSTAVVAGVCLTSPAPPAAAPLALLAWRAPEIVLARRARRRALEASSEVPLFLDLLAVATSAGLPPQAAVRAAGEPLRGPLAEELDAAIRRTDLGGRWREELADVAERLGLFDLRRAAAVLTRSERLGSALAGEVSRLAGDVREERRARAIERARTAPVKMLFPLVFLILPAFLLLTVVPVLLSTVRSIG